MSAAAPRRAGRPRLSPRQLSSTLSVSLPNSVYDEIVQQASRTRAGKVSPFVRRLLAAALALPEFSTKKGRPDIAGVS